MDIQRFGDNDTISSSSTLTMQWKSLTDNTKKYKTSIPDPKTNITAASIQSAMSTALTNRIFIDPSTEEIIAADNNWSTDTAYTTIKVTRSLDLS